MILRWLTRLFRRRSALASRREELELHLIEEVDQLVRQGIPEAAARRRARLELGSPAVAVEEVGDLRPGALAEGLVRDLRQAFRSLRRSPGFTIATLLLIAVGIGASTSIFTLVDRVLLQPLALAEPDRVVRLFEASPERRIERTGVARGNLAEWRNRARQIKAMAAIYVMGRTVSDAGVAEVVPMAQVTCDFVAVLGVVPVVGRGFTSDECRAARYSNAAAPIGLDPVVMLGHRFWRRQFGADPAVLGRTLTIERRPFRIIGVLPPAADLVTPTAEGYLAWELDGELPRDQRYPAAIARMAAGVSLGAASAELQRIAADLGREFPETNAGWTVEAIGLEEHTTGGARPTLLVLLAGAGLLLLIACANVALMFSARGLARSHEASLHLALGAPRSRVLRRGLMEALMVGAAGGVVGTALAFAAVALVRRAWPDLPRASELAPDGTVIGFAVVVTLGSGILAGLAPAVQQARSRAIDAMSGGKRSIGDRPAARRHDALAIAEVAVTVMLLVGAGLLVRTVAGLRSTDPGFDPRDVLVAPVFLDGQAYRSGDASRTYYASLFARLRAIPGVAVVGGATTLPTSPLGPDFARPVWPLDRSGEREAVRHASVRIVTPGYLDALRIRVADGRAFDERDGPNGRRVVLVSEELARAIWPGRSPIGEQLVVDYSTAGTYPYEVVGVAGNVRFGGPRSEPLAEVYFSHAQRPYLILNVAIRTAPGGPLIDAAVRRAFQEIDPLKPAQGIHRLTDLVGATFLSERRAMQVLLGFAAAAVLLSMLGVYGTIAFRVREKAAEIAVRLAIGATPGRVVRWVAGECVRVFVVGGTIGVLGALVGGRYLSSLLYQVAPSDGAAIATALVVLGATMAGAAILPAYRAARVDPAATLR
ncbi:MAG: ABC transporter permease [Gemmatimonadales bacterium]